MEVDIIKYYDEKQLKNYTLAKVYEKGKDYKKAVNLYSENIKKYNDSYSMVALAKLYLERKSGKINNEYVRKLLEDAYKLNNKQANHLLAYVWANGIGGEKQIEPAIKLFSEELNNNNPDPMIYIELSEKIMHNKQLKRKLKNAVSSSERKIYKRNRSIDKLPDY